MGVMVERAQRSQIGTENDVSAGMLVAITSDVQYLWVKSESTMWRLAKLLVGAGQHTMKLMRHPENRGAKVAIVSVVRSNNNLMKTLQTNSYILPE